MTEDDGERIGPINGHNKSEALPNGCAMLIAAVLLFIVAMGSYGFIADYRKAQAEEECPPYWQCTPSGQSWNHPDCKCWDKR